MWLMVRVASANTLNAGAEFQGSISFEAVERALDEVSAEEDHLQSEIDGRTIEERAYALLDHYEDFDAFRRGPLSTEILPVPMKAFDFDSFESSLYVVLAQKIIYPEFRILRVYAQKLYEEMGSSVRVFGNSQRKVAEEACFKRNSFTQHCVLAELFIGFNQMVIPQINEELSLSLDVDLMTDSILSLVRRSKTESLLNTEALIRSAALSLYDEYQTSEMVLKCLSQGKRFQNYEITARNFCLPAFEKIKDEVLVDKLVFEKFLDLAYNPYSSFQIVMSSLSEEVLTDKMFCFRATCREKKISSRLADWSQADKFSSEQRRELKKSILQFWNHD